MKWTILTILLIFSSIVNAAIGTLVIKIECLDTLIKYSIYDEDFNVLISSDSNYISLSVLYEPNIPTILYLLSSTDKANYNIIIINDNTITCKLKNCDTQQLEFFNSKENSIYQEYICSRAQINSELKPFVIALSNKTLTEESRDSIRRKYNTVRADVSLKLNDYEDEFFSTHSSSFATLMYLNDQLLFHRRKNQESFSQIIFSIDSNQLCKYVLYKRIISAFKETPFKAGDTLTNLDYFKDIRDDSLNFLELGVENEYVFIYFWKRGCPFSSKLKDKIDELISTNQLLEDKFIAINFEKNLQDSIKSQILTSFKFKCLFNDPEIDPSIVNKFWISRTPYCIIKKDDLLVRLFCSLDDFIALNL